MPTDNAKEQPVAEKDQKTVDIDTSGPEKDVAVDEVKEEAVVETKEQEPRVTEVKEEAKEDHKSESD